MESNESGARVIVREAVNKLRARHGQVKPIAERAQAEVGECDRFIKMFEKALGPSRARTTPSAAPGPRPAQTSPRAAFLRKAVALLVDGGRTAEGIANHFGAKLEWTRATLDGAVRRGELLRDAHGAYTVPEDDR